MYKKVIYVFLLMLFCSPLWAQQLDTIPLGQNINRKIEDTIQTTVEGDSSAHQEDSLANEGPGSPAEAIQDVIESNPLAGIITIPKIFLALVFSLMGYFTIRFINFILESLAERSADRRVAIKSYIPIVKIFGWIFIIIVVIAGIFQPPIGALVAVATSAGIAIGFAAQDILKNVFGGVMILLDRPFAVGDKIEIGSYYGEVTEIGLRSTRIVTPDDSLVSVPNGEVMNTSVSNSNASESFCQVVAEIYLPINVDTARVRQIALESAQVSKYVFMNKPIVVLFFNEVKERRSYLKMRLKAYVADFRHEFAFKSDMTEIVMKALLDEELIDAKDLL